MAEATTVQFDHVTRQAVDPVVVKVFGESINILGRIPKADGNDAVPTTRGLEISIYASPNPSFNWYPEGGKLAPPDHNEYVTGRVTPVRFSRGHEITGTAKRILARGVSIVGTLAEELAKTAKTGAKILEEQVCGTVTGELAVVVSSSGLTVTYATTYAGGSTLGTKKLRRRARITHYTAAGVQRSGGSVTLSTVSNTTPPVPSTGVVTYDAIPSDLAATDIAVYGDPTTEGSYNRATWGLVDIVNNTGVIFTLDRSVIREAQAFVVDAGGAAIGIARHRAVMAALHWRMEDEADDVDVVWSETQAQAFEAQGYNFITRQAPGSTFRQDFAGAQLGGKPNIKSWDIHPDRVYYLNFSMLRQGWLKEANSVFNDDGLDWRVVKTGDTLNDKWFIEYGGEGNLWAKQLNTHAVVKNLAVSGYQTYSNSL